MLQSTENVKNEGSKDDAGVISRFGRMRMGEANDMILRTRPKHIQDKKGSSGKEITCLTNYIPVVTTPKWTLYQYHVRFDPVVDNKFTRTQIVNSHVKLFGQEPIFDGIILYIPFNLPEQETKLTSINPHTGDPVTLTVKRTKELSPGDPQCITLYNLCNRKAFQLKGFYQCGRHFYDPSSHVTIPAHKIEIWQGFISAIRCMEEQLLMCCETSHKILRMDSVLKFMRALYNKDPGSFRDVATRTLVGASVVTRYNNKMYKIDGIYWDKNPSQTFQMQDGTTITLAQYYKQQYSKEVDPNQPLLMSRAKKRGELAPGEALDGEIFLIPELCAMTGLTEEMRNDRRLMQALAKYTRVEPEKRISKAREYLHSLLGSQDIQQMFARWSLSLGNDVASVQARVLEAERPIGGDDKEFKYNKESGDWSRESREVKLTKGVALKHWLFIYPKVDKHSAEVFFDTVKRIGANIGMIVEVPFQVELDCDRGTYLNAIKYGREHEPKAQMVVCMVPDDNKTRYDAIKKLCCIDHPIASQVIRRNTLSSNLVSVCTKIILQMNCKLGGSLWRVPIPMKTSMVIGYDAYHDSANRGKSVGAAVFSMDSMFTKWFSQCDLHGDDKELMTNLARFCEKGLKKYHEINGKLPERIVLYRDGCGDGQIPVVYSQELPQVQQAFKNIRKLLNVEWNPKLAFIIVTKKINTRFFQQSGKKIVNPPPGTIVDSVVTRSERYDWFLVPQCVRQGTVTPVSYNVIFDKSGLSPDKLQRLTYKLCHLYYNWQGTIRVPAPCQYAHKLAVLVAQSLHKPGAEMLCDTLYFL